MEASGRWLNVSDVTVPVNCIVRFSSDCIVCILSEYCKEVFNFTHHLQLAAVNPKVCLHPQYTAKKSCPAL